MELVKDRLIVSAIIWSFRARTVVAEVWPAPSEQAYPDDKEKYIGECELVILPTPEGPTDCQRERERDQRQHLALYHFGFSLRIHNLWFRMDVK